MNNQNYLKAEKFFEIPVMISVLMLIPVLIIEYTQQTLSSVALYLNWGIWIVFLLEYVILFYFADDKLKFVKSHKIELVIVIFSFPIVPEGLQSSGFLRFARLPRLLNALRFFRLAALLGRFGTAVKSIFNSKGLRFIVYATIGIVLFFGFLFYISEPGVTSYSDGLWGHASRSSIQYWGVEDTKVQSGTRRGRASANRGRGDVEGPLKATRENIERSIRGTRGPFRRFT